MTQDLAELERATGDKLVVVTLRKLEYDPDAFAFADKVLERWYPTAEEGDRKGVLLLVAQADEGALVGGPSFAARTDPVLDAVVGESLPILAEEEKYNEAVVSSVRRVGAALRGEADPGGRTRPDGRRKRTYRTREETAKAKKVTATAVGSLLFIAVVVPMLQFYGYTAKD